MKLRNDKTNPFSRVAILAKIYHSGTPMLTFAVKTAQKIHNITGEMLNLGTLKK